MASRSARATRGAISQETRNVVLSVVLSALTAAAVAFGVAAYSVGKEDERQRTEAERTRLSAIYLPFAEAASNAVACLPTALCSDAELSRAGREFNRSYLLTLGQGEEPIVTAAKRLLNSLGSATDRRQQGKEPTDGQIQRVADDFVQLQNLVTEATRP